MTKDGNAIAHRRAGWIEGESADTPRLDALDARLVAALQRDGRQPFRQLAGELGTSEATVRNRFNRLVDAGVLEVTAVTNPFVLGYDALALVGVRVGGRLDGVVEALGGWPEAAYVVAVTGRFDLMVELVCTDRHHLLETVERLRELDGVSATETFSYLKLCKQVYDWGPRLDDGAAGTAPEQETT